MSNVQFSIPLLLISIHLYNQDSYIYWRFGCKVMCANLMTRANNPVQFVWWREWVNKTGINFMFAKRVVIDSKSTRDTHGCFDYWQIATCTITHQNARFETMDAEEHRIHMPRQIFHWRSCRWYNMAQQHLSIGIVGMLRMIFLT